MDDSKVSILIVDDKPEKLLSLEAVLEDLGQNIVRAYSGREALRQVLQQDFAVILLDVNMPDMDGFETAQFIRLRPSSAHIPIIFLTAMSDEMHATRGYSLGAVDYILTPVVPQVLRSKVAVFVDLSRKTAQVEQQASSLRRRTLQLQKLASASVAINAAMSIDKMLQTITDAARDVINTHQAITVLLDPRPGETKGRVQSCASYSDKYASWRSRPLDMRPVAATIVARGHSATRMTEAELHLHPNWEIIRKLDIPPVGGGVLAAPLTGRDGGNLGVIYLCDKLDGLFSVDDETVLVQLAQMASIAIENSIFAEEREANRLKDEFLSTLSHELRTPLNAIAGWVQLLRMEPVNGDLAHGLEVIDRNVNAQTRLIEDLLDLSRITTGKLRLNARPINLVSVVEAAVEALRPVVQEKGVSLDCQIVDREAVVAGDPDRLQQVFFNLLNNAAKFTPEHGSITVRLKCEGTSVHLSVSDTGDGIDPEFLPHVFDRFRQADSTSSRRHGGLGIGLTIVQHIVSLHRGTVRAHSDGKGRGATFTILLPLSGAQQEPARLRSGGPIEQVRGLDNLQIMIVDDDPDAREVISHILQRCGAQVITAGSVDEAIERFRAARPAIVVSDLAMPHKDGFSLLKELKALSIEQGRETPVIALTAYARPEDQNQTFQSGFRAHLSKPVDPSELIDMILRCAREVQMPPLGVVLDSQSPTELRLGASL